MKHLLVLILIVLAAVEKRAHAEDSSLLRKFWEVKLDRDGDGYVTSKELLKHAHDMEADVIPSPDQRAQLIARFDYNNDGVIEWKEFRTIVGDIGLEEDDDLTPSQVHIAITGIPGEMVVMWVTKSNTTTAEVQYGLESGQYDYSATGISYTYDVGILGGWHGFIHKVSLQGLLPDTTYYYRVCSPPDNSYSGELTFTTAPFANATHPPRPFTFATFGDMGTVMPLGFAVTKRIEMDITTLGPLDMLIHAGDVAYGGTGCCDEWEAIWDLWGDQVMPLAANAPYMTAVGNHESYYNFTAYSNRLSMPSAASGGLGNFWFSFDYPPTAPNGGPPLIHWTFISTEHNYEPGSPQHDWLVADLAATAARRDADGGSPAIGWLVLVGHRPVYCSDEDEYSSHRPGAPLVDMLEPLVSTYHVDLVITGHMHCYERTFPVYNATVEMSGVDVERRVYTNPQATVYITQGTAGAWIGETFVEPPPAWSAARFQEYGYGRLTVVNGSALYYEYLHFDTGAVLDDWWIVKS